jgi:hypothetical protein
VFTPGGSMTFTAPASALTTVDAISSISASVEENVVSRCKDRFAYDVIIAVGPGLASKSC